MAETWDFCRQHHRNFYQQQKLQRWKIQTNIKTKKKHKDGVDSSCVAFQDYILQHTSDNTCNSIFSWSIYHPWCMRLQYPKSGVIFDCDDNSGFIRYVASGDTFYLITSTDLGKLTSYLQCIIIGIWNSEWSLMLCEWPWKLSVFFFWFQSNAVKNSFQNSYIER